MQIARPCLAIQCDGIGRSPRAVATSVLLTKTSHVFSRAPNVTESFNCADSDLTSFRFRGDSQDASRVPFPDPFDGVSR